MDTLVPRECFSKPAENGWFANIDAKPSGPGGTLTKYNGVIFIHVHKQSKYLNNNNSITVSRLVKKNSTISFI